MELLVYIMVNAFRIYVMFRFTTLFFNRDNVNRRWEIILFFLYFAVNSAVNLTQHHPLVNLLFNVGPYLLLLGMYPGSWQLKLLVTGAVYGLSLLWDALLYTMVKGGDSLLFKSGFATTLFIFLTELVIEHVLRLKKEMKSIDISGLKELAVIPVISILLTVVNSLLGVGDTLVLINIIGLFIINLSVFIIYRILLRTSEDIYNRQLLQQQNAALRHQYELTQESQENLRIMRHDIRKHMEAIRRMAGENRTEDIFCYLEQAERYVSPAQEFVKSGNIDIDSILNYKLGQAEEQGIKPELSVKVPPHMEIEAFDLNAILVNLLDNAIEALLECENKYLGIEIRWKKKLLYIKIKNCCARAPEKEEGLFKTTKEDADCHGLGLKSVLQVVEKYNGELQQEYEDGYFLTTVMIYSRDI